MHWHVIALARKVVVMIDLASEQLLSLALAAKTVPPARSGKVTHLSTILRWIRQGAPGPDGKRVKLEAIRLGGRWMTSREALQRFGERLTPELRKAPNNGRPPATRERASKRAERQLEKLGI
jgi:hypothetical protein